MTSNAQHALKPAGFWVRALASLVESCIWFLPTALFLLLIAKSTSLENMVYNISLLVVFWGLPSAILGVVAYAPLLTSHFGGTLGKLIAGLVVTDDNGTYLTYKRSFFRQNIAYAFSGLLLGYGFWVIARNAQKLGWHDMATGSRVWVIKKLWPIALALFIILLALHTYLLSASVVAFSKGPLKNEIISLASDLSTQEAMDYYGTAPQTNEDVLKLLTEQGTTKYQEGLDALQKKNYSKAKEIAYAYTNSTENKSIADESLMYILLAQVGLAQQDTQFALTNAQKAVALEPNFALAHATYGLSLVTTDKTKALEEIARAIELDPKEENYKSIRDQILQN